MLHLTHSLTYLSQYTQSPLCEGSFCDWFRGLAAPRNLWHPLRKFALRVRKFSQRSVMDKRTKEIKIRLTENEHERLLARCDRAHLAEWLRSLGLGEHVLRRRRVPDVDPALLRQVTGIGNNLNQIARKLHGLDAIPVPQQVSLLVVLTSLDRQLSALLETQRDRQDS